MSEPSGALRPPEHGELLNRMLALAPSGVSGAEAVPMLGATASETHRQWLTASAPILRKWGRLQHGLLTSLGWHCETSVVPFMLVHPGWPSVSRAAMHTVLREHGIKLRDAASFGLPGWLRLAARSPAAQRLLAACVAKGSTHSRLVQA